jgi:hypothetical protein
VLLQAGSVKEQAGEKLDRLGLLLTRQASKPRAAEPKHIAQNKPPSQGNSDRGRHRGGDASACRDADRKTPSPR